MNNQYGHLKLRVLPLMYKYVLFENSQQFWNAIPEIKSLPADQPSFLFHAHDDQSVLVPMSCKVTSPKEQHNWKVFRIIGDMPFGTVQGLIATITEALRKKGMGTCVISTYLTDFFFVTEKNFEAAVQTLKEEGWEFTL